MFERYTEQARSVIFWAREEAQKAGSEYIEPEHFLVGLLREDPALPPRFLSEGNDIDALLREAHDSIGTREAKGTNLDEPMSHPLKRVLAYGAEEAGRMHQRHIGTEHHLLGLLREPSKASLILEKYGVHLKTARQEILEYSELPMAEHVQRAGAGAGTWLRNTVGKEWFSSSTRAEDGAIVTETHRFHQSHEIILIERVKLSEDGKTLKYSQELRGPKQEHRFTIDFDVS